MKNDTLESSENKYTDGLGRLEYSSKKEKHVHEQEIKATHRHRGSLYFWISTFLEATLVTTVLYVKMQWQE